MRNKAFGGDLLLSLDWSVIGPHGYRSPLDLLPEQPRARSEPTGPGDRQRRDQHQHRGGRFDQDADGVTAVVRDREDGQERTIHAKYLLAADGANSFVRETLGITTTAGARRPQSAGHRHGAEAPVAVRVRQRPVRRPRTPGCLFQLGKRTPPLGVHPAGGREARGLHPRPRLGALEPWVTPEDVEVLRYPVYRFRESMTDEWRRDRIFLIGDAAHILWPFAGEGMCNGLRDASALTWRLDLVLRGLAAEEVLDTYEDDRKPNMQGWTDLSREIGLPCIVTDPEAAAGSGPVPERGAAGPVAHAAGHRPAGTGRVLPPRRPAAGHVAVQGQVRSRQAKGCSMTSSAADSSSITTDRTSSTHSTPPACVARQHRRQRRRDRRARVRGRLTTSTAPTPLVRPLAASPSSPDPTSTCSAPRPTRRRRPQPGRRARASAAQGAQGRRP